jgi:hypothetical protein
MVEAGSGGKLLGSGLRTLPGDVRAPTLLWGSEQIFFVDCGTDLPISRTPVTNPCDPEHPWAAREATDAFGDAKRMGGC